MLECREVPKHIGLCRSEVNSTKEGCSEVDEAPARVAGGQRLLMLLLEVVAAADVQRERTEMLLLLVR
jgi:hypothetical protein